MRNIPLIIVMKYVVYGQQVEGSANQYRILLAARETIHNPGISSSTIWISPLHHMITSIASTMVLDPTPRSIETFVK